MLVVVKHRIRVGPNHISPLLMAVTPLAVHNAALAGQYRILNGPQPNGIACPKCGAELMDSNPSITLTSYCEYHGTRVA